VYIQWTLARRGCFVSVALLAPVYGVLLVCGMPSKAGSARWDMRAICALL